MPQTFTSIDSILEYEIQKAAGGDAYATGRDAYATGRDAYATGGDAYATGRKRGTLGIIVNRVGTDLEAALLAKSQGLVDLKIVGERKSIEQMLTFSGYSPQEVEIHDAVTPKDQVRILLDWISSRAIDVLSTGDLNQLQLYHLLANPYHGSTLEEGMSRACLISYPGYPKLLAIVGPTGQQQPSFDALVIHTKNSVHLAYGLGIPKPKIALLSAIDAVTFEDLHTYNCRCLVAMSKNQQISGVELDGPMNLDTAIAPRSIKRAGLESAVTGQADVLIVDSHQTRSVLALTLEYFRDADLARIILGGRVPLTLFPHINQEKSILGSLAVALHVSRYLSAAQTFNWDTHIDPLDYVW